MAKKIDGKGYKRSYIMKKYNISASVARYTLINVRGFINIEEKELSSDRSNLSSTKRKNEEIDTYLLQKIEFLRNKKITINRLTINHLAGEFYKSKNVDKKASLFCKIIHKTPYNKKCNSTWRVSKRRFN
ncbi:hypothetical protein DMUE_1410 [Dictyocoela muelleri]|nr:hypothetical protein DMUE_1410 [Dictyocoela muelleri]